MLLSCCVNTVAELSTPARADVESGLVDNAWSAVLKSLKALSNELADPGTP